MLWVSLQPIDTIFANVVDAADVSWMYEVENFILNYTVLLEYVVSSYF